MIMTGYIWLRTEDFFRSCGHDKKFGFRKMRKSFLTTVRLLDSQEKFYGMKLNENVFSIFNKTLL
jgi:hypothetical protein